MESGYVPDKLLSEGSFGKVYIGHSKTTGEKVAIKIQNNDSISEFNKNMLKHEYRVYQTLGKWVGIPEIYDYFEDSKGKYQAMTMQLLGSSLECIYEKHHRNFSIKTILMMAIQMIQRIAYLHSKNYIHRDLKPANFLIGKNDPERIYLIDFGLSRMYKDQQGHHRPESNGKSLVGTSRYASINSHLGKELSRRDDLISLGYILIYFSKSCLPWQGLISAEASTKEGKYGQILQKKVATNIDKLCNGLPDVFRTYMNYVVGLTYMERPSYNYLIELFGKTLNQYGYENDNKFDWITS